MKKFVGLGLAIALMGTSVQAQEYTLAVTGPNGVAYNCLPEIVQINGVPSRRCVSADVVAANTGNLFNGGLAGGGAIAGIVVAVLAIALLSDSDSTTSTPSS